MLARTIALAALSRLGVWFCCGVLGASALAQTTTTPAPTATPVVLTNMAQIVAQRTNLHSGQFDAELEGFIVWVVPETKRLHVESGGRVIVVFSEQPVNRFKQGHRVKVRGRLAWQNNLTLHDALVDGDGIGTLPPPKPALPFDLVRGVDAFRYTVIRGVVRDRLVNPTWTILHMAHEGLTFEAVLPPGTPLPADLIDAEVELRGFSWPIWSNRNRVTGSRFQIFETNGVVLLKPGLSNRFDRPLLTCAEAVRHPQEWINRVRVIGTVTATRVDLGFYISDGTGSLHVVLMPAQAVPTSGPDSKREPLSNPLPGERVEVIGLRRDLKWFTPTLLQAEFRRLGRGTEIQPLPVALDELRAGQHPGRLVSLEARLLDHRRFATQLMSEDSFLFQAGDNVFPGRFESESLVSWKLEPGAHVRVTGVNQIESRSESGKGKVSTFQLLIRSPADIVPAPAPPFWTRPGVRRPAFAALGVGAVALVFILLQRLHVRRLEAQVARRTADLSGSNERLHQEVAARERAEGELRVALDAEKELNQLKSSFVSMVSHEFRTPLEVILSSSHILDRYLDRLSPEKRREQLDSINESVQRMSHLMEDILLLGKFEAARMTCAPVATDLATLCQRCVNQIDSATESACPIRLTLDGIDRPALADESLLNPVLTNLLSNAVKYSPPGAPVEFAVRRAGDAAEFQIRDQGRGIPQADQARLFTAFHRGGNVGQISGSGLGLVIVQRCVQLHGGSLHFVSREGEGSTFTVRLPLFTAPPHVQKNGLGETATWQSQ